MPRKWSVFELNEQELRNVAAGLRPLSSYETTAIAEELLRYRERLGAKAGDARVGEHLLDALDDFASEVAHTVVRGERDT